MGPLRHEEMSPSDRAHLTLGGQRPPAPARKPLGEVARADKQKLQESTAPPAQKAIGFHQMRPREVKKALLREQTLAKLIDDAAKSGGKKDFGGGVEVQVFRDSKGRPLAKITHTYRNWLFITRRKERLVDHTGHKIA